MGVWQQGLAEAVSLRKNGEGAETRGAEVVSSAAASRTRRVASEDGRRLGVAVGESDAQPRTTWGRAADSSELVK